MIAHWLEEERWDESRYTCTCILSLPGLSQSRILAKSNEQACTSKSKFFAKGRDSSYPYWILWPPESTGYFRNQLGNVPFDFQDWGLIRRTSVIAGTHVRTKFLERDHAPILR